jgi:predicted TIM-barrel fold metal-dependent hydrolase
VRIDVHAHYWTADYLDLLADLGKPDASEARGLAAGDGAEFDARLGLMDQAGIELQVLSACPQVLYSEDRANASKAARFVNDQYADLVERHRDHFRAFAVLPMPHLDESIAEMGRALDELRMAGLAMNTTVMGRALVEPGFAPIFAELNRRSAVLYLHPSGNNACVLATHRRLSPHLDGRSTGRRHDLGHASDHEQHSNPLSQHQDH